MVELTRPRTIASILRTAAIPVPENVDSELGFLLDGKPVRSTSKAIKSGILYVLPRFKESALDNPDVVLDWLRVENELRTAPSTQRELLRLQTDDEWMDVIGRYTFEPVAAALTDDEGFRAMIVSTMKTAAERWNDDSRFIEVSLWRKFNRAADIAYKVGDDAPQVAIHPVRDFSSHPPFGTAVSLFDANDDKPTIIISSSIT